MMAKNHAWHGFYSMDVYVDSVVLHDTNAIISFADSLLVIDDSTVRFSGASSMFTTYNLSYQYTDSANGYAYYDVKNAYDFRLYYYYNKDSLHYARVTSGIHNGWEHLFT